MDLFKVHKKIQRNQQFRLSGDFISNVAHIYYIIQSVFNVDFSVHLHYDFETS